MKRKHPMQHDDIEKALRLLSRAADRIKPWGSLVFTLQWMPNQKRKSVGKTGDV